MIWLKKLLPYLISESTTLSGAEKLRTTLGAFIAIMVIGVISSQFLHGNGLQILVTSMGASAVLLFAVPHSPLTQPWPLVGGHVISALIGVTCAIHVPDIWLAAALASERSQMAATIRSVAALRSRTTVRPLPPAMCTAST